MTTKCDVIRTVLLEHPEYQSFEQVQAECNCLGIEVGIWGIYFVARNQGRKLNRCPTQPDHEQFRRDLALTLLGLHKSADATISTLIEVGNSNRNGSRIPWETELVAPRETWELSVGQELIDFCNGDVGNAIIAVELL